MPPPPMPGAPPAPGGMAPPVDPMGGAVAPPGMPGMPGMPPMPTAPMSGPAGPPPRPEINGPLDTIGKVLYDANVTDMVGTDAGDSPDDLALKIWKMYGGEPTGLDNKDDKLGERGTNTGDMNPQVADKERKSTESARWKRLPQGKTISDIFSLEELTDMMNGIVMGAVKQKSQQGGPGGGGGAPGGPPGGGGMPPMPPGLAATRAWLRVAQLLDQDGYSQHAEFLDKYFNSLS